MTPTITAPTLSARPRWLRISWVRDGLVFLLVTDMVGLAVSGRETGTN